MTKDEAIALANSEFWLVMEPRDIALFQLSEPLLCMPFAVFHEAVEKALGRGVYTHEFIDTERLRKELLGEKPVPTLEEILDLIPADKRVIVRKA